jgi:hypothetical protein
MSLPNRVKLKYQKRDQFQKMVDQIVELIRSGHFSYEDIQDMLLIVDFKKEVGYFETILKKLKPTKEQT